MANYILRHVDDDLWDKFRARAEREGRALKWLLLELVRYYAKYGMPQPPKK